MTRRTEVAVVILNLLIRQLIKELPNRDPLIAQHIHWSFCEMVRSSLTMKSFTHAEMNYVSTDTKYMTPYYLQQK